MSGPPLFSKMRLWARRESLYHEILREALLLLRSRPCAEDEFALNRELYRCLLEVIRLRHQRGDRTLDVPPVFDAPNPPTSDEATVEERKRPDFRFDLIDHSAADLHRSVVPFVIECKRLGSRVGRRVLTELYVTTGVHRFVHEDWSYGRNSAGGAMVGYVQTLSFLELVREVNVAATALGLPALDSQVSADERLQELSHALKRSFEISPYALMHFWIDLRSPTS